MKTILAMGQSNAVGGGAGGAWSFPASVAVWNCSANTDALTGLGTAFVGPTLNSPPFTAANNMMAHACRYLSAELGEDVRLILVAKSGTPISAWSGVSGTMYLRMQAVLAAAGVAAVDAVLWHQGEADIGSEAAYTAAWNTLVGKLTTDGYIDANTPIVLGELAITYAPMNAVLRALVGGRIGLADIACFPLIDAYHYSGTALVRAGLEMAREVMKLPGPMNHEPEATEWPYVTAAGSLAYTTNPGVYRKIDVKAENGTKNLIQSGSFVADRLGAWEFNVRGYPGTSRYLLCLLDGTGAVVQYLAGTGGQEPSGNNAYVTGHGVVALGNGDSVSLGVVQVTAAAATVSAGNSAIWNRMTVRYLGRN